MQFFWFPNITARETEAEELYAVLPLTDWGAHEPATAQRRDESNCSEERKDEDILLLPGFAVHSCVSV